MSSLFERMRNWLRAPAAPAPATQEREDPRPEHIAAAPERGSDAVRRLASCADDTIAVALFDEVAATAGEDVAVEAARRALEASLLPGLRVRMARALDARGDDAAVEALLSRIDEGLEVPERVLLEAWARRAEVAERRYDVESARRLWERVLARDVDYPRARERLAALSGSRAPSSADAGATVMGQGTLGGGRYALLSELGRGAAGTVFLAEDVSLARRVALKVYHRRGRADRERLLHEARVPVELEHPGVVRVLDVDVSLWAIVMEFTEGSLKDAARREAAATAQVLRWSRSLLDTVAWLHARGIVHRDIKPSNLLLRGERVVLTDFGIAARTGQSTAPGEGSAGYMPEEQARGGAAHPAMDVHAIAVTLLEIFATSGAELPEPARRLLEAARAPIPAERPTVAEMAAVLAGLG